MARARFCIVAIPVAAMCRPDEPRDTENRGLIRIFAVSFFSVRETRPAVTNSPYKIGMAPEKEEADFFDTSTDVRMYSKSERPR
jgi:hypothetical protein